MLELLQGHIQRGDHVQLSVYLLNGLARYREPNALAILRHPILSPVIALLEACRVCGVCDVMFAGQQ